MIHVINNEKNYVKNNVINK